jgi:hypothetical protein
LLRWDELQEVEVHHAKASLSQVIGSNLAIKGCPYWRAFWTEIETGRLRMKQLVALLLLLVVLTKPVLAADIIVQPIPASDVKAVPIAITNVQPSGAWMWSLPVPGLGQVVMGEPLWGLAFFTATAIGCVVTGIFINEFVKSANGSPGGEGALLIAGTFMYGIGTAICWTFGATHARLLDLEQQREAAKRGQSSRHKENGAVRP